MSGQDTQPTKAAGSTFDTAPMLQTRIEPTRFLWEVAGLSHKGKVRQINEDHFVVARFGRFMEVAHTNLPADAAPSSAEDVGYGLVVADGLGGHAGGEVASRLAISLLYDLVLRTPDWIMSLADEALVAEVMQRAKERCAEIQDAIVRRGQRDPNLEGMATTLTIAATVGNAMVVTHVGDSRAYLLRKGRLIQLTRDHTYVQELVDQNIISPEDALTHKFRHVLTNALGTVTKEVEPDIQRFTLFDGDRILLCTDGLSSYVDEDAIRQTLQSDDSAMHTCQRLIDAALEAGGKDNVTVAIGYCRKA